MNNLYHFFTSLYKKITGRIKFIYSKSKLKLKSNSF